MHDPTMIRASIENSLSSSVLATGSTRSLGDRSLALGLAALGLAAFGLTGCLGGEGRPTPDGGNNPVIDASITPMADADPDSPDADPSSPDAGPPSACAVAMQAAPTGAAAIPFTDALATATRNTWDGTTIPTAGDPDYPGGKYRTLTPDSDGNIHPGCSTAGLSDPADIPGYPCAAKEYPFPTDVTEDTDKPIVLLIHGNSDTPAGYERFLHPDPSTITDFQADTERRDQLAELLPAAGYRTIAVDMRKDLVDDSSAAGTGNSADNIDHGWAVPITQELIKQVIIANPERRVSIVGFSLGATVVRDALRRLFVQHQEGEWDINVFARVDDVIVASGAHHGVSTFALCGSNTTMSGTVTCEMGQVNTYTQTAFHRPLNGPALTGAGEAFGGWYETPCADGSYAFGLRDACEGNTVEYTTITMTDVENGTQQDEFVSEHASRLYPLACANNILTSLQDFDTSAYFFNGYFRNHFGSVRSNAGLGHVMAALAD